VNVRRLILLVGAIVVIAGVVGLLMPVSIPGPDGQSIGCGNAVAADLTAARQADSTNIANLPILEQFIPHTDYVTQCQSALSQRRTWAIPVAVVGLLVVAGSYFVGGRTGRVRAG
jgi:hypothetical protein